MIKRLLLALGILLASTGISTSKTYVYSVYGLGGPIWSGGMKSFSKSPYSYYDYSSIVNSISKLPKGSKVVCVGHSLGANTCSKVQRAVKVDLTIGLDPTWSAPTYEIKGKGINYYSTNMLNPLGHAKFKGKNVKNIPTSTIHTGITYDKSIVSSVLKAIAGVR